jgi:hypothetical protein
MRFPVQPRFASLRYETAAVVSGLAVCVVIGLMRRQKAEV